MRAPDFRGWVAIGLFALAFFVIGLLALNPDLAKVELFAVLAQGVVLTGLIAGPVAYLYGTSKSSVDKDRVLSGQGTPQDGAP